MEYSWIFQFSILFLSWMKHFLFKLFFMAPSVRQKLIFLCKKFIRRLENCSIIFVVVSLSWVALFMSSLFTSFEISYTVIHVNEKLAPFSTLDSFLLNNRNTMMFLLFFIFCYYHYFIFFAFQLDQKFQKHCRSTAG